MKMSTKARYGIYACIRLAEEYNNDFVSTAELAKSIGVSDGYLEQIIAMLKKDGIVISQRGATGGYKLSDKPCKISVGRILRCVEDNLEIVDCLSGKCTSKCTCVSRGLWQNFYDHINLYLDSISLQQLLDTTNKTKIYLDNAATTSLDECVLRAMMPYLTDEFGNSHSQHFFGRSAMTGVDTARKQVADAINASPNEIYFTASGTEADNWAVKGISFAREGKHVIVSAIEHHAILNSADWLSKHGYDVTYLPVDNYGVVKIDDLKNAIRPDTILVSIMLANNEVGTIQPIKQIAEIIHSTNKNTVFHVDAVQAIGAISVDVKDLGVDLLSLSAHKFYGPKGVGALYIKNGVRIDKLIVGGGQERSMRGGTSNTAGIVGMGAAISNAVADMEKNSSYIKQLRDAFVERVKAEIPYVHYNGHPTQRLPGNASFSFEYIEGESILMLLDFAGIAVSSGSACSSGSLDPSHVLLALGVPIEVSHGTIRFTFGKHNTMEQVNFTVDKLKEVVSRLRNMSPLFALKQGEIKNV